MTCEGFGRRVSSDSLVPCGYEGTVTVEGGWYCYAHSLVRQGFIVDMAWRPVGRFPREEPEIHPLDQLLQDVAGAGS